MLTLYGAQTRNSRDQAQRRDLQVTALLDPTSLESARLVSRTWCRGLSQGVATLQPRMEANAVGLQWSQLHKLQV